MAPAKVVNFDYYEFLTMLQRASSAGKRIDKDDSRWTAYIKQFGINEIAATAIARQKFEHITPVIIAEGLDTDGLYFYTREEEACLRLVPLG
jgi:hypothetical protein